MIKTKKTLNLDFSSICISIMIVVIMFLILVDPVTYSKSVINGLSVFFYHVLPGLLPFMFFIKQLTNQNFIFKLTKPIKNISNKLFNVNEYGFYAFIMSTISGYPIGSKITSDLFSQGKINNQNLLKTAILSSTPGLIFVIGSVGAGMLQSIKLGVYIYVLNIISAIILGIFINIFSKKSPINKSQINLKINQKLPLSSITQDTTLSILAVGFYIALFSLIITILTNLKVFSFIPLIFNLNPEQTALFQGVMSGIIEMTNGVKMLSSNITPLSLAFISSIISFSGISIIMQSLSFLSQTNIKSIKFILFKLLQSIICFILSFCFFSIL